MTARKWILAGAATALVATAGLGFGLGRLTDKTPAAAEEHAEEEAPHKEGFVALSAADAVKAGVMTTTVGRGGGSELVLPGRVALAVNASAALGAPVSGTVERVHVAAGDRVAAGSAIATLRSADGAGARASVDAAAAGARAAQAAAARDRRLFEAGVVARQDWEASQASADKAQAELRAARAQVAAQGAPSASGLAILRAPIAGVITRIDARVGGFLTQGGLVAEIADQGQVEYVSTPRRPRPTRSRSATPSWSSVRMVVKPAPASSLSRPARSALAPPSCAPSRPRPRRRWAPSSRLG
jgi:cobalt-zinc-cadmium efflux system membrane fusion protein